LLHKFHQQHSFPSCPAKQQPSAFCFMNSTSSTLSRKMFRKSPCNVHSFIRSFYFVHKM
jgi:hypothetical protein